jgi:uncharacterized membrane protein YadS
MTFMLLLTHVMLLQYAICLYGKWLNALSHSEVMAACLRVLESICASTVFTFVFVYFILVYHIYTCWVNGFESRPVILS